MQQLVEVVLSLGRTLRHNTNGHLMQHLPAVCVHVKTAAQLQRTQLNAKRHLMQHLCCACAKVSPQAVALPH